MYHPLTAKEAAEQVHKGEDWMLWYFQFVDDFRKRPSFDLISEPPNSKLERKYRALIQSIVLCLINEKRLSECPQWCENPIFLYGEPWFISGLNNLRAMAIQESPLEFRRNNIFVLDNFMHRV